MLASPLQRLAASATDALLIFAIHAFVWLLAAAIWPYPNSRIENAFQILSPILCWLYVWLGWQRGATLGKKLWRIRIVATSGEPMNARRAVVRCIAYVLASLPVKAGLLPILFHPHRQGWHDRVAGTLVVRDAATLPLALPKVSIQPRPEILPADLLFPRHGWPLALFAYVLLAVVATWPVAAKMSTHIAGAGGDGWVFYWNYWLFSHAIDNGASPLSTEMCFYPQRVPLLFHTMNWFNCALAYPLLRLVNLCTTYNILFLLSLSLSAFAAYWLCCSLTKQRAASFIAASVFGFSPFFWTHGTGHANLIAAQFLPIFVLFSYAALTTSRRGYALAAGASFSLGGYCDFQYVLFSVIWLACLLWGLQIAHESDFDLLKKRLRHCASILMCGAVLLSPLLIPALLERDNFGYMNKSGQAGAFQADLSDYIAFNPFHPLARDGAGEIVFTSGGENLIAPGFLILLLSAVALWLHHRRLRLWLLCGLVFLVLSCGPHLKFRGLPPLKSSAILAIGGVPGNGFDLPWDMSQMIQFSQIATVKPQVLWWPSYSVLLPFDWLRDVLPVLKPFRAPARLAIGVLLCCAVLAAFALASLQSRCHARWGILTSRALMLLLGAAVCFEALAFSYPIGLTTVHPFFHRLARDREFYAIVEAPLVVGTDSHHRQTVHGKAIFVGNLARAPREAFRLPATNALLRFLSRRKFQWKARDEETKSREQTLSEALTELRNIRTRYIVVFKQHANDRLLGRYDAVLRRQLNLPMVLDDAELRVYRL